MRNLTRERRALVALAIGGLVAVVARANYSLQPLGGMSDFDQVWIAARALLAGRDPYAALRTTGWPFPLYYPLTAAVVVMPYALLPVALARVAFIASGAALLAWALSRRDAWGPVGVFTGPMFVAFSLVQWSPLLTGATALPAILAGAVLAAKPTIGLAIGVAYFIEDGRRAGRALAGALVVLAASLALRPSWPATWLATIQDAPHLVAPVTLLPMGPFVLLALLRWRRPEARLLAALACVPQTFVLYEVLPLILVARSRQQLLGLTLLGDLAFAIIMLGIRSPTTPENLVLFVRASGQVLLWTLYLPCVVMVMRRPNEGRVPAWLDRALGGVRSAGRGSGPMKGG